MADVGAALAGPFDKYLSEWDKMRQSDNVENRIDEPWPTVQLPGKTTDLPQTKTGVANADNVLAMLDQLGITDIPPATRLGIQAGIHDMNVPSKEEMLKYLMVNEATGPNPPAQVPLPRPRPKGK